MAHDDVAQVVGKAETQSRHITLDRPEVIRGELAFADR